MKSFFLAATFATLAIINAKAQKAEMAQAIVHYKFIHLRDTTQRDKPYTENMVLFVGPTASAYKSYDRKLQNELIQKQIAQQVAEQKGSGSMHISVNSSSTASNTEYYSFPLQNKFIRKEKLITPYLIEEPTPLINWKIGTDTASFGTLHCQKATGHFKGRDYTAWFCPDVPLHAGPWKLSGLPGLIVEAYDTKKEVVFKFDSMEEVKTASASPGNANAPVVAGAPTIKMIGMDDPNVDPNLIAIPADAVKTTEKEFKNLQDAMKKDPQAFMQSALAGSGISFKPAEHGAVAGTGPGGQQSKMMIKNDTVVINNPLELPEKK
jgi:GLPGLI family protein